ncbi:hypothetical protein THOM_0540, partial [Trachipleistophora hominis]
VLFEIDNCVYIQKWLLQYLGQEERNAKFMNVHLLDRAYWKLKHKIFRKIKGVSFEKWNSIYLEHVKMYSAWLEKMILERPKKIDEFMKTYGISTPTRDSLFENLCQGKVDLSILGENII